MEFIAIDGEGITLEDNTHIYNLLGASDTTYIYNENGCRTMQCFDYLLGLSEKHPDATFVSFYFSYDVNMILGNVHMSYIKQLAKTDKVYLFHPDKEKHLGEVWKVEYLPRKFFKLCHGKRIIDDKGKKKIFVDKAITVWDVFGFFQSSFVNALKQFNIGTPEEIAELSGMKNKRADFDTESIDNVIKYNQNECRLLVDAMNKLNDALITAGIPIKSWHGAGAIAGELMRKNNVKTHIKSCTDLFKTPVLSAYFGGRIQSLIIGEYNNKMYSHDIISAYPSTIQDLPSLKNHREIYTKNYNPDLPYTIWHVKWDLQNPKKPIEEKYYNPVYKSDDIQSPIIAPFPFRDDKGSIFYPLKGEGYYWNREVKAAIDMYGDNIKVIEGFQFEINNTDKPFDFVPELFEKRKQFKKAGNHAQIAIKLGLNSLYGKTAQGKGFGGRIPAYQSYIWAGLITSETRAKLLELAKISPKDIIAFATDGVLSRTQLIPEQENKLGNWEIDIYDSIFNIKPGFYQVCKGDKKPHKIRGYRAAEINFDDIKAIWNRDGIAGTMQVNTRQFVGMKIASDNLKWRTWIDGTKQLSLFPTKGIPQIENEMPLRFRELPKYKINDKLSAEYEPELFETLNPDTIDIETEIL